MKEILSVIATGILGLLWWDIRGVRKERESFKKEIEDEYLTEEKHGLLCSNVVLRFENMLTVAKQEIIEAIKNNGACGGCQRQPEEDT